MPTHTAWVLAEHMGIDAYRDLIRAVGDFEGHAGPDFGKLTNIRLADHVHVYRGNTDGVHSLFAIAVPDEQLTARITVTDSCPNCAPPQPQHDPGRRYIVEYEIGW